MFPYARSVVGDVVGALSSIPVLIAGTLLTRKKIWVVALLLIAVNGVLFAVTEVDVERNTEWQGAVLGSIKLLITAELMGRVRESAEAEEVGRLEGPLPGWSEPRAVDTPHRSGRICLDPQGQLAEALG